MKTSEMTVTLVDHMGSDLSVVNAARVSFDKESEWEFDNRDGEIITTLSDKDANLIKYLAANNHWSPFAHTSVQFRIKAPIFVARQLVKHQVGLVWNEVSRRYVDSPPEFWLPEVWRGRPEGSMKQGSSGRVPQNKQYEMTLPNGWHFRGSIDQLVDLNTTFSLMTYRTLIEQGVAPEQARMILPQNTMTEWIWTGSLMAFARVCKLRLDPHAQEETREIAALIAEHMATLFPVSWKELMK